MRKLEVELNTTWIKEIIDIIVENLDIDTLAEDEKETMEIIVINAIALYQGKITEHLVSKTDTLN